MRSVPGPKAFVRSWRAERCSHPDPTGLSRRCGRLGGSWRPVRSLGTAVIQCLIRVKVIMSINPNHLTRKFITWILVIHFLLAGILFGVTIVVQAIPPQAGLIVASLLFLTIAPTTIIVAALQSSRSNWTNGLAATRVACRRAGYIYGAFSGGILGAHYWGNTGAIALGFALFLVGLYFGNQIGAFAWARIKGTASSET
jgi:hypothetical protein